jgi:hypothetical protein
MRFSMLLVLLLVPGVVLASEDMATISWEPPIERTDGTPLSAEELDEYVFSCRIEGGEHEDLLTIPAVPGVTQHQELRITLFPVSQDYWCAMRVTDTVGLTSLRSDEVLVTHRARPGSPSNVIIEGDLLVRGNLTVQGTVRLGAALE